MQASRNPSDSSDMSDEEPQLRQPITFFPSLTNRVREQVHLYGTETLDTVFMETFYFIWNLRGDDSFGVTKSLWCVFLLKDIWDIEQNEDTSILFRVSISASVDADILADPVRLAGGATRGHFMLSINPTVDWPECTGKLETIIITQFLAFLENGILLTPHYFTQCLTFMVEMNFTLENFFIDKNNKLAVLCTLLL